MGLVSGLGVALARVSGLIQACALNALLPVPPHVSDAALLFVMAADGVPHDPWVHCCLQAEEDERSRGPASELPGRQM